MMDALTPFDPVLPEVERFLEASQMTPTVFGRQALGDPNLVRDLREGRECKRATRERIRTFIRSFAGRVAEAAALEAS